MGFFLIITMLPMFILASSLLIIILFVIFWSIAALMLVLGISGIVMNAFQKRAEVPAEGAVVKKAVGTWRNVTALILSAAFGLYPIIALITIIASSAPK